MRRILKRTLWSTIKENENVSFGFIFTLLLRVVVSYHWKASALQKLAWETWGQSAGLRYDLETVTPAVCWAVLARLEAAAKGESLSWHMMAVFKQHTVVKKSLEWSVHKLLLQNQIGHFAPFLFSTSLIKVYNIFCATGITSKQAT